MQPEATPKPNPAAGLPPVEPPSARLLVRMFLVPFVIVAVVVAFGWGLVWMFSGVVGTTRTPAQFLRNLDNANAEVRWRAASDLAQVLLRDEKLAANPTFALDLAERLRRAMTDNARSERALLERLGQQSGGATVEAAEPLESQRKRVQAERDHMLYLCSCLGKFLVPVGMPLQVELTRRTEGAEEAAVQLRRRQAVWDLACLGNNVKRFDALPSERRDQILATLREEAESPGERGGRARDALDFLETGRMPGVVEALAETARADDPYLRKQTALALSFWKGERSEEILVDLTADDGHGGDRAEGEDRPLSAEELRRRYAVEIRYQAVLALARLGSRQVDPRLDTLAEMLDYDGLLEKFRTRREGREVPEVDQVHTTVLYALQAVAELHRSRPDLDLSRLRPAVLKLKDNVNPSLRTEAERTRLALGAGR